MMETEALEHLVRGIVDNPDDVSVRSRNLRRGRTLEVHVHPDDIGKVIGRNGRTATAIRTVVGALSSERRSGSTSSTSSTGARAADSKQFPEGPHPSWLRPFAVSSEMV